MKIFLAQLLVAAIATTIVGAAVFRSRRASGILRYGLKVAYIYIIVIVAIAMARVLWG